MKRHTQRGSIAIKGLGNGYLNEDSTEACLRREPGNCLINTANRNQCSSADSLPIQTIKIQVRKMSVLDYRLGSSYWFSLPL